MKKSSILALVCEHTKNYFSEDVLFELFRDYPKEFAMFFSDTLSDDDLKFFAEMLKHDPDIKLHQILQVFEANPEKFRKVLCNSGASWLIFSEQIKASELFQIYDKYPNRLSILNNSDLRLLLILSTHKFDIRELLSMSNFCEEKIVHFVGCEALKLLLDSGASIQQVSEFYDKHVDRLKYITKEVVRHSLDDNKAFVPKKLEAITFLFATNYPGARDALSFVSNLYSKSKYVFESIVFNEDLGPSRFLRLVNKKIDDDLFLKELEECHRNLNKKRFKTFFDSFSIFHYLERSITSIKQLVDLFCNSVDKFNLITRTCVCHNIIFLVLKKEFTFTFILDFHEKKPKAFEAIFNSNALSALYNQVSFNGLVELHEQNPVKLEFMSTRFVDYLICNEISTFNELSKLYDEDSEALRRIHNGINLHMLKGTTLKYANLLKLYKDNRDKYNAISRSNINYLFTYTKVTYEEISAVYDDSPLKLRILSGMELALIIANTGIPYSEFIKLYDNSPEKVKYLINNRYVFEQCLKKKKFTYEQLTALCPEKMGAVLKFGYLIDTAGITFEFVCQLYEEDRKKFDFFSNELVYTFSLRVANPIKLFELYDIDVGKLNDFIQKNNFAACARECASINMTKAISFKPG